MPGNDAISQKPFWQGGNMVANRMLQIQHTDGNHLLTRLNEALNSAGFEGFSTFDHQLRPVFWPMTR
jgi:hypothetical protein